MKASYLRVVDMDPEYAMWRLGSLCFQNGINLEKEGCTDLWDYMRKRRGLRWQPRGWEAHGFYACQYKVDAWLFSGGCDKRDTQQPYNGSDWGQWWPVVVAFVDPQGDDTMFFTCPSLARNCERCWLVQQLDLMKDTWAMQTCGCCRECQSRGEDKMRLLQEAMDTCDLRAPAPRR